MNFYGSLSTVAKLLKIFSGLSEFRFHQLQKQEISSRTSTFKISFLVPQFCAIYGEDIVLDNYRLNLSLKEISEAYLADVRQNSLKIL